MDKEIKHPEFYPRGSLDNKQNIKRISRILPDGSIVERVYLDVPDIRYREQLICMHYLQHLTRNFLQEDIGIKIIGRDAPWDFKIELSNGDVFNVEITSIADNSLQFENNKKEERYNLWSAKEMIPLFELKKLVKFFPDKKLSIVISEHENQGIPQNELVKNPYYPPTTPAFVSLMYETNDKLTDVVLSAIEKKLKKKHEEKENTILIIDNRTGAYDVPEYFEALNDIHPSVNSWPFPEIWFYTGYYSDDRGIEAEYSFAPLKATAQQSEILQTMINSEKIDKNGIYITKT